MAQQGAFLTGSPMRHVTVMSMTASIGLIAIFAVDFVDMIFISMLGQAELAAAVGYAGALLFFTTSFGIGMSIAAGALVSRALGAGDEALARRRTSTALIYAVLFGAVFSAVIWVNLRPLAALLGATGDTLDLAVGYLQIILPSLPLLMVGMIGSAILRAHGAARLAMMATIWGGLVNAVLDPILIFGLNLDLTGAALASVAARVTIAITALRPLIRELGGLERPDFRALAADFIPVFGIALPAILTQLATPVGQAYVTRTMAQFGPDAIAGMAIVGRLTPMSFAVIFALSGAVGPIVGQNYGAGRHDRVRASFRDALLFTALYVGFVAIALFLLRDHIIALFDATGQAALLVTLFCGPLALAFFFNGVIFVANASFNNLGRPFYSTWINWGRHTLGTVPFVMLGGWMFGAAGVLIGQAVGGVLFAVLAFVMARHVMVRAAQGDTPQDSAPFQGHRRFMTLFHHRR